MPDESFRVCVVGCLEHDGAISPTHFGKAIMHIMRCHEPEPGVPMLFVVPVEEIHAMHAAVFDGIEAIREIRPVLHGLELRF